MLCDVILRYIQALNFRVSPLISIEFADSTIHPQVEKDSLHFKGVGGADKKTFELNMKFLKEV